MGILKKLAGESAIYGLSTILGRLINYLLVPLYTAIFDPDAFGVYSVLYAYAAFLQILFTFGMETAYFRYSSRDENESKVFNQIFTLVFISSIILSAVIFSSAQGISQILEYESFQKEIKYLSIILGLDAIAAIPFTRLRFRNKAWNFAIIKLINILLNVGFNVFFYLVLPRYPDLSIQMGIGFASGSIAFIFISNLLASAFTLLLLSPVILQWRPIFEKGFIRQVYGYSFPIMLMGIAGIANEMLDKILLKEWLPDNFYNQFDADGAVGIYSAAAKLAIFMMLMIQSFRFASEPFFFKSANSEKAPEDFAMVMKWFVIVGMLVFVTVTLNLDLLKYLLRSEVYWTGLMVVPVLLLAKFFLGVYYNLSIWFKLTDKTRFGMYFSFIGAGITIVANFILIPLIGYMGSAFSAFLAYLSMMILCYIYGQKNYPIPYKIGNAFTYILVGLGIIMLDFFWRPDNQILATLYHLGLILLFLIITFFKEFSGGKSKAIVEL
ncbi:MAG: oligosaccharide flippase family protein [Cytophagales bacterium]